MRYTQIARDLDYKVLLFVIFIHCYYLSLSLSIYIYVYVFVRRNSCYRKLVPLFYFHLLSVVARARVFHVQRPYLVILSRLDFGCLITYSGDRHYLVQPSAPFPPVPNASGRLSSFFLSRWTL